LLLKRREKRGEGKWFFGNRRKSGVGEKKDRLKEEKPAPFPAEKGKKGKETGRRAGGGTRGGIAYVGRKKKKGRKIRARQRGKSRWVGDPVMTEKKKGY